MIVKLDLRAFCFLSASGVRPMATTHCFCHDELCRGQRPGLNSSPPLIPRYDTKCAFYVTNNKNDDPQDVDNDQRTAVPAAMQSKWKRYGGFKWCLIGWSIGLLAVFPLHNSVLTQSDCISSCFSLLRARKSDSDCCIVTDRCNYIIVEWQKSALLVAPKGFESQYNAWGRAQRWQTPSPSQSPLGWKLYTLS